MWTKTYLHRNTYGFVCVPDVFCVDYVIWMHPHPRHSVGPQIIQTPVDVFVDTCGWEKRPVLDFHIKGLSVRDRPFYWFYQTRLQQSAHLHKSTYAHASFDVRMLMVMNRWNTNKHTNLCAFRSVARSECLHVFVGGFRLESGWTFGDDDVGEKTSGRPCCRTNCRGGDSVNIHTMCTKHKFKHYKPRKLKFHQALTITWHGFVNSGKHPWSCLLIFTSPSASTRCRAHAQTQWRTLPLWMHYQTHN